MLKYIVGIDVGGTSIKIGIFDLNVILLKKWDIPTNSSESGKYILEDIYKSLAHKIEDFDEVLGFGFGVPGPIINGMVFQCVNLGWKNYDLIGAFSKFINNPYILVANDANLATLGETTMGAARGYKNSALLTLGTGVGGGIVTDGNIIGGAHGSAGEIGHLQVIREFGRSCNCGNTGCLETVASATGIKKTYLEISKQSNIESSLKQFENPSAKAIIDAAKHGDLIATLVVENFTYYVAYACHVLSVTTNPDIIIIGGGVSKAGKYILNKIESHFRKFSYKPVRNTKIVLAELGNDAGIYGAAALVKNHG